MCFTCSDVWNRCDKHVPKQAPNGVLYRRPRRERLTTENSQRSGTLLKTCRVPTVRCILSGGQSFHGWEAVVLSTLADNRRSAQADGSDARLAGRGRLRGRCPGRGDGFCRGRARGAVDRNAARFRQAQNLSQAAFFLRALGDLQGEDLPPPGAQSFVNSIAGVDEFFHGLYCKRYCAA